MSDENKRWDEKYGTDSHSSLEVDPFFTRAYDEFISHLFPVPGTALDVAGGVGRHSIFLARAGWQVTLVDISAVGIRKASANLLQAGAEATLVARDLSKSGLISGQFDLVLVFFFLEPNLFPQLMAALKPGGLLLYKTYTKGPSGSAGPGPTHPMHLLEPNQLLKAFSELRVLHYRETVGKGTAELVAHRPAAG